MSDFSVNEVVTHWKRGVVLVILLAVSVSASTLLLFLPVFLVMELSGYTPPSDKVVAIVAAVIFLPYWLGVAQTKNWGKKSE